MGGTTGGHASKGQYSVPTSWRWLTIESLLPFNDAACNHMQAVRSHVSLRSGLFRLALSDLRAVVTRLISDSVTRRTAAIAMWTVIVVLPGLTVAQPPSSTERPTPQQSSAEIKDAPAQPTDDGATDTPAEAPVDPVDVRRKEGMATIAVLLLAGIAAIGVATIGIIVIWGFSVRRTIREPLPKTAKPDELWYLRSKSGLPREERPRTGGEAGASDSPPPSPADAP
jgi:hypothetical protein